MVRITKKEVADLYRMDLQAQLHVVDEKIAYFERKYHRAFTDFEQWVQSEGKDYEYWDDYIEWKAYTKTQLDLQQDIGDLQRADIQITE